MQIMYICAIFLSNNFYLRSQNIIYEYFMAVGSGNRKVV